MTTTQEIFALAQAALEFDLARRVALQLKNQRNACRCERAEPDDPDVGANGTVPCWKDWLDGVDDRYLPPLDEWCGPCRERQRLHEAYRQAMTTRGARLRVLQRFALRGIDPRSIDREVRKLMDGHEGATEQEPPGTEETQPIPSAQGDDDPGPADAGEVKTEESAASE